MKQVILVLCYLSANVVHGASVSPVAVPRSYKSDEDYSSSPSGGGSSGIYPGQIYPSAVDEEPQGVGDHDSHPYSQSQVSSKFKVFFFIQFYCEILF